jgi:hypothetical protein
MPEAPDANGSSAQQSLDDPLRGLSRRPEALEVFRVLEADYRVPPELIDLLGESVSRAVATLVDGAVKQRRLPTPYAIVRVLDTDWWR